MFAILLKKIKISHLFATEINVKIFKIVSRIDIEPSFTYQCLYRDSIKIGFLGSTSCSNLTSKKKPSHSQAGFQLHGQALLMSIGLTTLSTMLPFFVKVLK